jgi:putative ABC transport system permease protein
MNHLKLLYWAAGISISGIINFTGMFRTILKLSIRNILKHKLFTLINITGLAIGLTASLLIILHVLHEYNYDSNWVRAEDIYRISYDRYQNGALSFKSARSPGGMARVLREKISEVEGSTEIFKDIVTVYNETNQIDDIRMFATDSTFFSVFKLDFIDKQGDNPLIGLYSSVLSESAAISLFGTADVVGKWYKVCQGWRFYVAGVYRDLPILTCPSICCFQCKHMISILRTGMMRQVPR